MQTANRSRRLHGQHVFPGMLGMLTVQEAQDHNFPLSFFLIPTAAINFVGVGKDSRTIRSVFSKWTYNHGQFDVKSNLLALEVTTGIGSGFGEANYDGGLTPPGGDLPSYDRQLNS